VYERKVFEAKIKIVETFVSKQKLAQNNDGHEHWTDCEPFNKNIIIAKIPRSNNFGAGATTGRPMHATRFMAQK
jgi:hypothetical protein